MQTHAYHWVDERAFRAALQPALAGLSAKEVAGLSIDEWIYGSGLPDNVTAPAQSAMWDRVAVQSTAFRNGKSASQLNRSGWTTTETSLFLQQIADILPSRLADVDAAFGFSQMHTPPTLFLLAIAKSFDAARLPVLENYLMRGTPNSSPIWSELGNSTRGRQYGTPIYQRARDFYAPWMQAYIDSVLHFVPLEKAA